MKLVPLNTAAAKAMLKVCPQCNKAGRRVSAETVRHLVQSRLVDSVAEGEYALCMTATCDVAYYSLASALEIDKAELNIPLWHKQGASPRYACYCNKVTIEQVRDAVMKEGARSVNDVTRLTGAMRNCDCLHNNPLGKCCNKIIQEIIREFAV